MSTHHIYSPSSFERRFLCNASASLEAWLPEMTSEIAESGTRIHAKAAELISCTECTPDLEDINEQEKAEAIRDFFKSKAEMLDIDRFLVEQKLSYKTPFGEVIYYGTCDAIVIEKDGTLHIYDWKTGYNQVTEASENLQGKLYAIAAMQEYKSRICEVTFFNPTIRHETSAVFDENDAKEIINLVMETMVKCASEEATFFPGDKQCKYCKGALTGTCRAWTASMILKSREAKASVAEMDDHMLASEYERVTSACASYAEALKNELQRRIKDTGEDIGDYYIKQRTGKKSVKDINGAFTALSDIMSDSEFLSVCSLKMTDALNMYSDKYKSLHPDEKKTAKAIKDMFNECIEPFSETSAPIEVLAKRASKEE